jgi:hypothetical protein
MSGIIIIGLVACVFGSVIALALVQNAKDADGIIEQELNKKSGK